jgi:hypothetical protein
MKRIVLHLFFYLSFLSHAQIEGYELGLDGFFSASTMGGGFGVGPKLGFRMNENLILGPCFRYQRSWSKNNFTGQEFSFNNFGGGFFLHGRYKNTVFGGIEAEILGNRSGFIDTSAIFKRVVPTVFICGGFSKEFNQTVRLNLGIYYDIVNSLNSPFRSSYVLSIKNPETGQITKYLPIIYRISFFFPLGKKKEIVKEEIEEESY